MKRRLFISGIKLLDKAVAWVEQITYSDYQLFHSLLPGGRDKLWFGFGLFVVKTL